MCTVVCCVGQALGHDKYGVLGWSDGGITGIILAANQPSQVDRLVVWGANAFLTQQDIDIYQGDLILNLIDHGSEYSRRSHGLWSKVPHY